MNFRKSPEANKLFDLLLNTGFSYVQSEMIVAQAALETGNFTSALYLSGNNPFGMKRAALREQKGVTGTDSAGHVKYKDLNAAVNDYRSYWIYFKYPEMFQSVDEFVTALKRNRYFEIGEEQYRKGVNFYYKKYFE